MIAFFRTLSALCVISAKIDLIDKKLLLPGLKIGKAALHVKEKLESSVRNHRKLIAIAMKMEYFKNKLSRLHRYPI
jgi:hypothetical protein